MTPDVAKAKQLLKEAGFPKGFKTQLGYRSGDQLEEEIAVILKTAFAQAGVELELLKMPASTLVEKYTKAQIPMYFFRTWRSSGCGVCCKSVAELEIADRFLPVQESGGG